LDLIIQSTNTFERNRILGGKVRVCGLERVEKKVTIEHPTELMVVVHGGVGSTKLTTFDQEGTNINAQAQYF